MDTLRDVLRHGSAGAKAMAARARREMDVAIDVEKGVEKDMTENVEEGEERQ